MLGGFFSRIRAALLQLLGLPSLDGLIVGEAPAVGVRYIPPTEQHPPLRLFYPATASTASPAWQWFGHDSPLSADLYLAGLLLVITDMDSESWTFGLLRVLATVVSYFLPLRYRSLPGVHSNLPLHDPTKQRPVIFFSHGLTGSGLENALLCAAWARRLGAIVVAVHHQDGSSACVPHNNKGKKHMWYQRGPPLDANYDGNFRLHQVQGRVQELRQAMDYMQNPAHGWAPHIQPHKMVAAGFSYGAATIACGAVQEDFPPLCGLVFLDGWFYIDVAKSAGVEFEFPPAAFAQLSRLHQVPTCFLNSAEFVSYAKLWKATLRLAGSSSKPVVLEGTTHNNFCELWCWMPNFVLRYFGAIGKKPHPKVVYREIIETTSAFLKTTLE